MRAAVHLSLRSVLLASSLLLAAAPRPDAPKPLQPPPDQALLLHLKGIGDQIYVCQSAGSTYAWKLKAPAAKLFRENGELAGQHSAGPTWQANDGSRVTGKLVASVPSPEPGSIPWLLLTANSHAGTGILSNVESVQRLNTEGGAAPANGCAPSNANGETPVPYQADYYFYGIAGH